jgi:branched-subunit amino acid aminotransferase/4-amino-4-deoxychorismate lyase
VAGRPRFPERHAARIARSARELGLGEIDPAQVVEALRSLAQAAFGEGDGVVRIQASRDGDGQPHLVGVPRPLGEEPAAWSAIVLALSHAGAGPAPGLKVSSRLTLALAGDAARAAGADEALLLDGAGFLVEGSRSNVVVVPAEGGPVTPPDAAGGVSGIARGLALERVPELREAPVPEATLRNAREVIAVNAVRGARPIVTLDGAPVGDGKPGAWARALDEALGRD